MRSISLKNDACLQESEDAEELLYRCWHTCVQSPLASAAQALMLRIQPAGRLMFAATQSLLQCGAARDFLESPLLQQPICKSCASLRMSHTGDSVTNSSVDWLTPSSSLTHASCCWVRNMMLGTYGRFFSILYIYMWISGT